MARRAARPRRADARGADAALACAGTARPRALRVLRRVACDRARRRARAERAPLRATRRARDAARQRPARARAGSGAFLGARRGLRRRRGGPLRPAGGAARRVRRLDVVRPLRALPRRAAARGRRRPPRGAAAGWARAARRPQPLRGRLPALERRPDPHRLVAARHRGAVLRRRARGAGGTGGRPSARAGVRQLRRVGRQPRRQPGALQAGPPRPAAAGAPPAGARPLRLRAAAAGRQARMTTAVPSTCLCGATAAALVQRGVRHDPGLEVHRCASCGLVYLWPRPTAAEVDREFDVVTAFHVLEHVHDPHEFLRRLSRLLRPDGILVVEVPNVDDALVSTYDIPAYRSFYFTNAHLWYFSPRTLDGALASAKLDGTVELVQRYDLSNHLVWMQTGRPGGFGAYPILAGADEAYAQALVAAGVADTLWVVARPR